MNSDFFCFLWYDIVEYYGKNYIMFDLCLRLNRRKDLLEKRGVDSLLSEIENTSASAWYSMGLGGLIDSTKAWIDKMIDWEERIDEKLKVDLINLVKKIDLLKDILDAVPYSEEVKHDLGLAMCTFEAIKWMILSWDINSFINMNLTGSFFSELNHFLYFLQSFSLSRLKSKEDKMDFIDAWKEKFNLRELLGTIMLMDANLEIDLSDVDENIFIDWLKWDVYMTVWNILQNSSKWWAKKVKFYTQERYGFVKLFVADDWPGISFWNGEDAWKILEKGFSKRNSTGLWLDNSRNPMINLWVWLEWLPTRFISKKHRDDEMKKTRAKKFEWDFNIHWALITMTFSKDSVVKRDY